MAKTYFHRSTALAVGFGVVDNEVEQSTVGAGAATLTSSFAGGESRNCFVFTTLSGQPNNANWPRGTYRCIMEISVAGADITYGLRAAGSATGKFVRVSSDLATELESIGQSQALFSGTGIKTGSAIWDPAAGAASDRFSCLIVGTRPASMFTQDLTIVVNATDAGITNGGISDGPFITDAAAFTFANATRFANQSHLGPFKSSGGSFYTILRSTATSSVFGAFKATDPTSSWSNIGTNSDLFSEILSACVVQVGDVLHVATLCADSYVRYHRFNMATDAWLERGTGASFTGSTATEAVCLGVRSDGDVVIAHKNEQNLRYSRLEAGTWTTDVEVAAATGPPEAPVLVMDANDRAHMFWPRSDNSSLLSKTLSSTNGLSAETTVDSTTTTGASYTAARGITYDAAGTKKIRVPYQDSNNKVSVAKADSADSPAWSVDLDASDVAASAGFIRFGLALDGTTTYLMYVDGTTGDIFYDKQLDGGSWGVDVEAQDAVTALWLSANVYDRSGKKLAYLWDSNGTLSYAEVSIVSGQTIPVGQVTETDTGQAIAWAPKRRLVGQVAEVDLAQVVSINPQRRLVGQVAELDLAQGIGRLKVLALGQASELDLAQAITAVKRVALGQASEVDLAQPIGKAKRLLLGLASELDLAQTITRAAVLGQVSEADLAQTIRALKIRVLAQASEINLAQVIAKAKTIAVGQASEVDLAQVISWAPKHRLIAQASELDLAQTIAWAPKHRLVGQASEVDLAQVIDKGRSIGQVAEVDLAQIITRAAGLTVALGEASEIDVAQPIAWAPKRRLLGQASELDLAQAIGKAKRLAIGQVAEVDLAQLIGVLKLRAVGQASEVDLAQTIGRIKARAIGQVSEVDLAQPIGKLKRLLIGQASELDLAQTIGKAKRLGIGQVAEVDLAQTITWSPKRRVIVQVVEVDTASGLVFVVIQPVVGYVETWDEALHDLRVLDQALHDLRVLDQALHDVEVSDGRVSL